MTGTVRRRLMWSLIVALCLWGCGEEAEQGPAAPPGMDERYDDLDDPPEDDDATCTTTVVEGVCMPEAPRPTPMADCPSATLDEDGVCIPEVPRHSPMTDCPSGQIGPEGICAPQAPALRDWDCPEGWLSTPAFTDEDGQENPPEEIGQINVCEPPELPGDCPLGQMPLLGQAECVDQGLACPDEGSLWHDEATIRGRAPGFEGAIVRAAPDGQGDGSAEAPAGLLEALALVEQGGILALAPGTYTEALEIDKRMAIVGACVAGTRFETTEESNTTPTVKYTNAGHGVLSDLTISGPRPAIRYIGTEGPGTIQAVRIDQATVYAIEISGADAPIEITDTLITHTQPKPSDRTEGGGIRVLNRGDVRVRRTTLKNNHYMGVELLGRATVVSLSDVAILDTQPRVRDDSFGFGVQASSGPQVTIERALLDGNHGQSMIFFRSGTEVSLRDVVVRRTIRDSASRAFGRGLSAEDGAHVSIRQAIFDRNRELAISSQQAGTLIEIEDVLIKDTFAQGSDFLYGIGLNAIGDGRIVAERAVLLRNRTYGVLADGAEIEISDVVVTDTKEQEGGKGFGRGLGAERGGKLTVRRALAARNRLHGLFGGDLTTVDVEDLRVTDTRARFSDDALGIGLGVSDGAVLTLARGTFERNRFGGIVIEHGPDVTDPELATQAQMSDILIKDTLPQDSDQKFGRGLFVVGGAKANLTRGHVTGSHYMGVHALGAETALTMADVVIDDTHARQNNLEFGRGLQIEDGARGELVRGEIRRSHEIGVMITSGSELVLHDVTIRETQPQESRAIGGRGLYTEKGSLLQGARVAVLDNHEIALFAIDGGTRVELTDLRVAGTLSSLRGGLFGRGLDVEFHAQVSISRAAFVGNREIGVFSGQWSQLDITDLIVRDTQPRRHDLIGGRGVNIQGGANATIERAHISNNFEYGIVVLEDETTLTLGDLFIGDTQSSLCEEADCPFGTAGSGLSAVLGASVDLDRFFIEGSAQAGLQIALEASLQGRRGAITGNSIGVNVQIEALDLHEAFEEVRAFDNGVDFDAQDIAPPSAADALDAIENVEMMGQ